jgi:hypothetical protein
MNVGTKSLLVGVHQIAWHPFTVLRAWVELYGYPSWKEMICIIIHDWGYWGSPNMDGIEGETHPEFAMVLACKLFPNTQNQDNYYGQLCLLHSRHYARKFNLNPSKLCWADKLSIKYDPRRFYLLRARLSGELKEYRALHASMGEDFKTDEDWYDWASGRAIQMGMQQNSEGISFHPQQEKTYENQTKPA